jgi:hypothetical protein
VSLAGTGNWAIRAALTTCVAALLSVPGTAQAQEDAPLVFCLGPAQRHALIDAAVALGRAQRDPTGKFLLVMGNKLDPFMWRAERPNDFASTCNALYASSRLPAAGAPSAFAGVLPFLTAIFGALLAFAAATWRDRVTRGRALGDALRSDVTEFHDAAEAYLGSAAGSYLGSKATTRSDTEVTAARRKLLSQMAVVKASRRKWTTVTALQSELTTGELGEKLTSGWSTQDEETRKRLTDLPGQLGRHKDSVLEVAIALEQPLRRHRALRGPTGRWWR